MLPLHVVAGRTKGRRSPAHHLSQVPGEWPRSTPRRSFVPTLEGFTPGGSLDTRLMDAPLGRESMRASTREP